ncbi:hypothetical protein ACE1CI_32425 [Aerosakkonemataceae cyanobacterium BLCC-F50]|uniref:Uncharacterized protein n=1 Tax=Floridaenema flaviceps BLCC-F50 TaxID=3153642 RepID=A0ABV4Y2H2_9CYAN
MKINHLINLILRLNTGLVILTIASVKWQSISREWENAAKDLTSTMFWQEYLQLNK